MKNPINKNHILILLFFVLYSTNYFVNAQELKTEILNTTNGLSNNKVKYLFQDSFGFLWIGTDDGLNRYDGYEFKVFKNDPGNSESINSNVIWCITEDEENNLWIATGVGVSKYIRAENKFKNYDLGRGGSYFSSIVTFIDSKKNIWASVETENINKYNKLTDSWEKQKFVLIDSIQTYRGPIQVIPIMEDTKGKIWAGSVRHGLMWYDEKEKVFREAEIKYEDGVGEFTNAVNTISDIFSDSLGVLWITSINGIYKYNSATKKLKTIKKFTFERVGFNNTIASITQDPHGNVWVTSRYSGLLKFDGISDNYKRLTITGQNYSEAGISNYIFTKNLWDRSGIFWMCTYNKGLIKYDPNKKRFTKYSHTENDNNSISNSNIYSLLESKTLPNTIYVGTNGGGLNTLNTKTNNFSTTHFNSFNNKCQSSVGSIIEEDDGSLWLGTFGGGLIKVNPERKIVKRFILDSTNSNSISNNNINIIKKDSLGNLWIGAWDGGLNFLDEQTNTIKRFSGDYTTYPQEVIDLVKNKVERNLDIAKIIKVGDFQNLSVDFEVEQSGNYLVIAAGEGTFDTGRFDRDTSMWDYGWIENDNNKTLWTSDVIDSTYHIGGATKNRVKIGILSLKPGKYSLKYKSDDSHSFGNWNTAPPNEQSFWGARIFRIDNQSELENIKKHLKENVNKKLLVKGASIRTIHLGKNNILWVGTWQYGLHKINITENYVKTFLLDGGKKKPRSNISINDICEGEGGTIWVATNGGLFKFDSEKETYTTYADNDGLSTSNILSILPGDNNELWISTKNGISQMVENTNGKPIFINYGIESGLDIVNFIESVKLKTNSGKYFFGGNNGLIEFDSQKSLNIPPKLILSDLKISNLSISKIEENELAKTNILNLKNISLNHTQNDLSFEFTALHFSDPKNNKYAHKLEGYEGDWIYDNSRIATYTNLDPGEYTFKFKGSNSEGLWNETGKSISIKINPPWWKTIWAYILYGLLLVATIWGIDRFQKKRLLAKAKERIKIQDAEHRAEAAELQAKVTEAEKRNIELDNERKTKELEEARQLQLSMLPKELPQLPHLDIAVYMKTATEVGGDYYDFNVDKNGTLTVVVGDATGHGLNAGTVVTATKSLFGTYANNPDILFTFSEMTRVLKGMKLPMLAMCLCLLKIKENQLTISSAGIPPALIYRSATNKIEEFLIKGMPLGVMNGFPYELRTTEISSGDIILLMSDGFPELQNNKKELFGYERVKKVFSEVAKKEPEEIIEHLKNTSSAWVEDAEPDDDVTFVVIKIK
ncbi:MAG: SpoIIE family protein phosphatase [Melioribacteraceae bacterium]